MANCDTFEIGNNLAERKPNWKLKRLHIAQKVEEDNEEIRMQIMRILWKVKWKRKCKTTPCTQNIENMIIKEKDEKWGFFSGNWEREKGKNVDGELRQHFYQKIEEGDDEIKCKSCKIYWWWREKKIMLMEK